MKIITKLTIFLLLINFLLTFALRAEFITQENFKFFLNEYYLSNEKGLGASQITYALLKGRRSIAIKLIENGGNLNEYSPNKDIPTPLMLAIINEDEELVDIMIKNGVDINFNWYFVIHYDAKNPTMLSPIELAIRKNYDSNIVSILAKHGATIQNGGTPEDALRVGIWRGDSKKFFAIIENSTSHFDIQMIYNTGFNLLTTVPKLPESYEDQTEILKIAQYLIDQNVNSETSKFSALSFAISQGNMRLVELLINAGADVNYIPEQGCSPIFAAIAYNVRVDPLLYSKFMAKSTEALTLLLDLNVSQDTFSPIYKDSNSGFTPLGYAMHIKANEAAEKLIEFGANLDKKDIFEQTPLVRAIEANNIVGVKLLIDSGANIKIAGKNNLKPIEIALSKRYYEIYNLLLEAEADCYSIY